MARYPGWELGPSRPISLTKCTGNRKDATIAPQARAHKGEAQELYAELLDLNQADFDSRIELPGLRGAYRCTGQRPTPCDDGTSEQAITGWGRAAIPSPRTC